jgi:hypothetical protein
VEHLGRRNNMTLKGTKTLGKRDIDRFANIAKEMSEKGIKYKIDIYPKTMGEYFKFKELWDGFVVSNSWMMYKGITVYKP